MMLWRTSKYEISCCGSSPRSACISGSVPPRVTVSSRCVHSGLSRRELPMSTHEGNCLSPEQIKEESWSESITGRSSAAVAALRQVLCDSSPFGVGNVSHAVDPTPPLGTPRGQRAAPGSKCFWAGMSRMPRRLRLLNKAPRAGSRPSIGKVSSEIVRTVVITYVLARPISLLGVGCGWTGAGRLAIWLWFGFSAMMWDSSQLAGQGWRRFTLCRARLV
jgi:hypothetical protein